MCAWNCEGWLQKLNLKEVVCFLLAFDIFFLSETFVDSERQYDSFSDYDVFVSTSTELSFQGRKSRGVLIFLRKHLSPFVKHIEVPYENVIALEVCKTLLGSHKNAFLISAYIPPMTVNFETLQIMDTDWK